MAILKGYEEAVETKRKLDYWLTEEGQAKLDEKAKENAKPPNERLTWQENTGIAGWLCPLDFDESSRAKLAGSLSPLGEASEWVEIKLTADSGACDTVIPKTMCPSIPIVPSQQSLLRLVYEVANGQSLPNLGERRCELWTEGATQAKSITMQVADVHKGLLSLSRCADMGFESRFGKAYGCLIDTASGEVIPLQRK